MRFALSFLFLWGCASASQKAADQAELRKQEASAVPIRHPFEQLDGHVASDVLGGNYQLLSVSREQICFRTLIPSEGGNEMQIEYYLIAVDADGASRSTKQKSLLQLGLSQQTTLNVSTSRKDMQAAALGSNDGVSASDSSDMGKKAMTSSTDYQRVRVFAAMNVCFDAQPTLTDETRYMVLQRGPLALMNPHPLRGVWSLSPISAVAPEAAKPAVQHANPFAPSL